MSTRHSPHPSLIEFDDRSAGDAVHCGRARAVAGSSGKRPLKPLLGLGVAALLLIVSALLLVRTLGGDDPGDASRRRTLIDANTGEVFRDFSIKDGSRYPYINPRTGEATLYVAEKCYWNRDGTVKIEPTYVFVKRAAGINEDTYCPDCGRLVVTYNPPPPMDMLLRAAE